MGNTTLPNNSKKEIKSLYNLIEYEEYFLIKENNVFKFIIEKEYNNIIIKCQNYEKRININDLSILNKSLFKNIDDAYEYINNLFENNKVNIKDININKSIKLTIFIDNKKNTEIVLVYNKKNKNNIINELKNKYKDINNEINYLKNELNILKKEMPKLKNNNLRNIKFINDLSIDSYAYTTLDNTFSTFKSIDNILYLIYANQNKSIISYNLINNKKLNEIKNAHNNYITNFRHYLDNIKKRDLIISLSKDDNNLKLWNINNFECLLNLKNINNIGILDSACFLNQNNKFYILTSNCNVNGNAEPIKVYDFNGSKIKQLRDSTDDTYFIDTYHDNNSSKIFIITGNFGYVKSYDYNNNKLYYKYGEKDNYCRFSVAINDSDKDIKLIETSVDGNIRIWNFYSGKLLNKIKVSSDRLYGVCLWDNDYLFVACKEKVIKLVDIKNKLIINNLIGHTNNSLTIKKINHPIYGKCLISQGFDNIIKLWGNI